MAPKNPQSHRISNLASHPDDVFFEVRFTGEGVSPATVALRSMGDALSAVQNLAAGTALDNEGIEQGFSLVRIEEGSARYHCLARVPGLAEKNLAAVGRILDAGALGSPKEVELLVSVLNPMKNLSQIAKSAKCRLEIRSSQFTNPLFVVDADAYDRIAERVLLEGETTICGKVESVGGSDLNKLRCKLRIPGRRHQLACSLADRQVAQHLAKCLWQDVVASGKATWVQSTWQIHGFEIRGVTQPSLGNVDKAMESLRLSGLDAWDDIDDPEAYLKELRG